MLHEMLHEMLHQILHHNVKINIMKTQPMIVKLLVGLMKHMIMIVNILYKQDIESGLCNFFYYFKIFIKLFINNNIIN
jgi:hypothetical protein